MSWPVKKRRKLRWRRAEKVLRREMPPVATRRGRPVTSSGTLAVPEAGARRSEVGRSDMDKAETGTSAVRTGVQMVDAKGCWSKNKPRGARAAYSEACAL